MSKNLVVSAVGNESQHPTWLAGPESRRFDLCLVYYGDQPGQWSGDAEYYLQCKGLKYRLLYNFFQGELAHLLEQYDQFWLADDDIAADTATVNQLFDIAADYQLQICQPAIGQGDCSYEALKTHDGYLLRYTQFVEMMCPLFSRKALVRTLPVFAANRSGWGIDWVWSSLFGPEELAVIDATPVHHTRPLQSGEIYKRIAEMGVKPGDDYDQIVRQYRLNNRRHARAIVRDTARLRGVDPAGNKIWTCSRLDHWLGRRAA